jgi:hypothetical protein
MSYQRLQVDAVRRDNVHEPSHALLPTWAESRYDSVVAESRRERTNWDLQVAGVDAKAREGSAWSKDPETGLECRLRAQSLDRHIDAPSISNAHDLVDRVNLFEINGMINAEQSRHLQPGGNRIDADNGGRS